MKNKFKSETLVISITKNKKDEYLILRNGGMLKCFEEGTMSSIMILRYAVKLGIYLHKLEMKPVKVVDNFTVSTPCCTKCGSTNVETKAWQNFRNGSLEVISSDRDDNYCNGCNYQATFKNIVIDPKVGIEILNIE